MDDEWDAVEGEFYEWNTFFWLNVKKIVEKNIWNPNSNNEDQNV